MKKIILLCRDGTFCRDPTVLDEALVENSLQLYDILVLSRLGRTIFRGRISPLVNRDPGKTRRFFPM